MEAEIKKIILDVDDKEIELLLEQAKKLHELLDGMFGKKYISTSYPIFIRDYQPYWSWPTVTWCGDETGTTAGNLNQTLRGVLSYNASDSSIKVNL